jgi:hypothetical protein
MLKKAPFGAFFVLVAVRMIPSTQNALLTNAKKPI